MNHFFLVIALVFFLNHDTNGHLPVFKDGETVVLIGDSITHGGGYPAFIQLYTATQFPGQKISYFNGGISGDDANGTLTRLEKDILIHNPNHAIIMLGMNDIRRTLYSDKEKPNQEILQKRKEALRVYSENMNELSAILVEKGIKPIFMTPSIYDQTSTVERENNYGVNDGLIEFGKVVEDIAKKYKAPLVDLNSAMLAVNRKVQSKDKSATIVGHDRIHPGDEGHLIMAYEIIKKVFPTTYVSKIEINAKTKEVVDTINTEVVLKDGTNEFMVFEKALPFVVKESLKPTRELIKGHHDITKQLFSVKNLNQGMYQLVIDEIKVGRYSNKALQRGIDLSENTITPQYKQAQEVSELCFSYKTTNSILRTIAMTEFRTLRDYDGPNTIAAKKEYLNKLNESQKGKSWYEYQVKKAKEYFDILPKQDSLWSAMDSIRAKIYTVNQPKWHQYRLVKD